MGATFCAGPAAPAVANPSPTGRRLQSLVPIVPLPARWKLDRTALASLSLWRPSAELWRLRVTAGAVVEQKVHETIEQKGSVKFKAGTVMAAATEHGGGEVQAGRRKRLAVFVSGGGSNFRAIHKAMLGGAVNGDIVTLVTDKPGCGGAEHARSNGIPVVMFPQSKSAPKGVSVSELLNTLRGYEVDFVILAGYLKLIPAELVREYPRSILNIHPSLLPAFGGKGYYGLKVHKAVIASGARYSGPTVHFVDEHYDTGKTLAQRVVPVLADDTAESLARRVLHEEHQVYVEAVTALCDDRIVWREDGVPLIKSRTNPNQYT